MNLEAITHLWNYRPRKFRSDAFLFWSRGPDSYRKNDRKRAVVWPWLVLQLSTVLALTHLGIRQSDWRRAGIRSTNLHIVVEYGVWALGCNWLVWQRPICACPRTNHYWWGCPDIWHLTPSVGPHHIVGRSGMGGATADLQYITLAGNEGHTPPFWPLLKWGRVLVEYDLVIMGVYYPVYQTVVCKEMHDGALHDERRQRDVNKRHFLFRLKKQGSPSQKTVPEPTADWLALLSRSQRMDCELGG